MNDEKKVTHRATCHHGDKTYLPHDAQCRCICTCPATPAPESWEEALQFEIMEDYLTDAEFARHATDRAAHLERMRGHFDKLKAFISALLAEEREKGRTMKGSSWREGYERGMAEALAPESSWEARLAELINELRANPSTDSRHIHEYVAREIAQARVAAFREVREAVPTIESAGFIGTGGGQPFKDERDSFNACRAQMLAALDTLEGETNQ